MFFSIIVLCRLVLGLCQNGRSQTYTRNRIQTLAIVSYSCKFQTVFTPSCLPGKHLLSYYHKRANVADMCEAVFT